MQIIVAVRKCHDFCFHGVVRFFELGSGAVGNHSETKTVERKGGKQAEA
jgi:hypothetical protein